LRSEYTGKLLRFKRICRKLDEGRGTEGDEEEMYGLMAYLAENNSFDNPMDRESAERIIKEQQKISLEINGGYPLRREASFKIAGEKYTVIAYGTSGENEGEDALFGIIFVKEGRRRCR